MSENVSTKSLALFVTNKTITYLTKTAQQEDNFYSESYHINYCTAENISNENEIRNVVKANLPLLLYYDKIFVCYQSIPFTIVPEEYYNNQLIDYYQLLSDTENENYSIKLNQPKSHLIFKNINPIHKILNELSNYKNAIFLHTGKLLIDNAKVDVEKIQIFIQIINQKLELCIYNKGIFTLYNIYDIINDNDIIYYILNTIQQHNLDPTITNLIFDNEITINHPISSQLQKYVSNISFNEETNLVGLKHLLYKIFECE
jgi:hypothetical protein